MMRGLNFQEAEEEGEPKSWSHSFQCMARDSQPLHEFDIKVCMSPKEVSKNISVQFLCVNFQYWT